MPHDPETGERLIRQTPQQIVDRILATDEGTRFQCWPPVVRVRKGTHAWWTDWCCALAWSDGSPVY